MGRKPAHHVSYAKMRPMKDVIRPVKGTKDYYPQDMAVRSWLYRKMRMVSESFGYEEYEGPILESFDLYAAKSGEELVEKQSYVFEDRGGERITLRPELTPTLARMVAQKQNQLTYPLRWWSFGPFWRYERPQKGRTREFFQWNIDMIGDGSPEADAELAAIAATFLKQVGLKPQQAKILINDRRLMESETTKLGISEDMRPKVYQLIDRHGKMQQDAWERSATEIGLSAKQVDAILTLTQTKNLWEKSQSLQAFFEAVDAHGLSDYIQYAPEIIRGLDYYTGTVMEAWATSGEFRAIFGGGRYDNLVSAVGGQAVTAVGFAVGNMVIGLLLEKLGLLPNTDRSVAPVLVTIFGEEQLLDAIRLSAELRGGGLNVSIFPSPAKLGKQFKYADRIGARFAIVLGPDEIAKQEITIKDLSSGDQTSINRVLAADHLQKLLEGTIP